MEEQADPRDTACESMHLHPDKPHVLESSQPLTWVGEIVWSRILQACASPARTHTQCQSCRNSSPVCTEEETGSERLPVPAPGAALPVAHRRLPCPEGLLQGHRHFLESSKRCAAFPKSRLQKEGPRLSSKVGCRQFSASGGCF